MLQTNFNFNSARFFVFAVLFSLSLGSSWALAQDDVKKMKEVQVRATNLESDLSSELAQYGHRVEVVTGEQIEKNNIQDVPQALEMLAPGVHLTPKNGRADYVNLSIQGARSQNVLLMLDGVRFNNRLFATTTILDSISPHMIERIEILKGGQGVFYGTQGIGGVINIITKKPKRSTEGEVSFGAGTPLNDRNIAGYVTEEFWGSRVLIFGNSDQADGYRPFKDSAYETTATKEDRGFNRTNVGIKVARDFGDNKSLNLFFQRNDVDADFARPYQQFQNASNDRDQHIFNMKFEHAVNQDLKYLVKGYYHDWWTEFTRVTINDTGNLNVSSDDALWGYQDYGANALVSYNLNERSEVIGGVDFQRYYGEDRVFGIFGDWESVYAPFAQYRTQLGHTSLAFSGRHNIPSNAEEKFIWEATTKHDLNEQITLRVKTGNSFRLPSQFELFGLSLGNPNLDPEESVGFEAGIEAQQRLGGMPITYSADYFQRTVEDLIQVRSGTFQNTRSEVETNGVDLQLGLRFSRQWNLKLSSVFTDSTENGSNEQVNSVPEANAKGELRYRAPSRRYQLSALAKQVGTVYDVGETRDSFGNYTVLDFTGAYDLDPKGTHSINFRLENVLDEEYTTSLADKTVVGGGDVNYANRGVPRNLQLEYTHSF